MDAMERAEQIFYQAVSSTLTHAAFRIYARALERENKEAAAYLAWLCSRKEWPRVG